MFHTGYALGALFHRQSVLEEDSPKTDFYRGESRNALKKTYFYVLHWMRRASVAVQSKDYCVIASDAMLIDNREVPESGT